MTLKARPVTGVGATELVDPDAGFWKEADDERISLMGTPLGMQPTGAIRVAWAGKTIGVVDKVKVAAVHDGTTLAFRLEWDDENQDGALGDTTSFPDAAALVFPVTDNAPLITMGAAGAAVNAWYWRADENDGGREVVAEGIGSSETLEPGSVSSHGVWRDGTWSVVITRALQGQGAVAQLSVGQTTGFGVAIWEGSQGERAGIKAFSGPEWLLLEIESKS